MVHLTYSEVADSRPAAYMENMVTIYRGLEATFSANFFQHVSSGTATI